MPPVRITMAYSVGSIKGKEAQVTKIISNNISELKKLYLIKVATSESNLERGAYIKEVTVESKTLRGAKVLSNKHVENSEYCLIYLNRKLQAHRGAFMNEWSDPSQYCINHYWDGKIVKGE